MGKQECPSNKKEIETELIKKAVKRRTTRDLKAGDIVKMPADGNIIRLNNSTTGSNIKIDCSETASGTAGTIAVTTSDKETIETDLLRIIYIKWMVLL